MIPVQHSIKARTTLLPVRNFKGGMDSISSIGGMDPRRSRRLQNCYDDGYIKKVPGYEIVNDAAVAEELNNGHEFRMNDGTIKTIVSGGGKIYWLNGSTLSAIKTGLDVNARVNFATMKDLVLMANGVDAPMKYDGSTVAALPGGWDATTFLFHVHKNRAWAINRDNKMIAEYSDLEDPETMSGFIDFSTVIAKGDELVEVKSFIDYIVFIMRDHILIYSGTDPAPAGDFALAQRIDGVGAYETGCAKQIGSDLLLMTKGGLRTIRQVAITGNMGVNPLAKYYETDLANAIRAESGGFAMAHYPELSWVMMLVGDTIYVYDYVANSMTSMIVGADAAGLFDTVDGSVYITGNGNFYEYGAGWDFDGDNIEMWWESADLVLSRSGAASSPKFAVINFGNGPEMTCTIQLQFDENVLTDTVEFTTERGITLLDTPMDDIWESVAFLDHASRDEVREMMFGRGKAMRISLMNDSASGPLQLNDMLFQLVEGGI